MRHSQLRNVRRLRSASLPFCLSASCCLDTAARRARSHSASTANLSVSIATSLQLLVSRFHVVRIDSNSCFRNANDRQFAALDDPLDRADSRLPVFCHLLLGPERQLYAPPFASRSSSRRNLRRVRAFDVISTERAINHPFIDQLRRGGGHRGITAASSKLAP